MTRNRTIPIRFLLAASMAAAVSATVVPARGQAPAHEQHARGTAAAGASESVADQLVNLRIQVAALQAALDANHQRLVEVGETEHRSGAMMRTPGMGMRMMRGMSMAGAGDATSKRPDPVPPRPMRGMERMGKANRMRPESALPGIPGASHIYHIGSTGFFLDHPQHITLTREQIATLNQLKENSLLETATSQRKIDEAEQQLWQLTGSDQPDAAKLGTKLAEIEKLRTNQRFAFIRAVGQAAKVLTEGQRLSLLGMMDMKPGK